MKRYTHLIWDFNGTLLDDVPADFGAANRLLRNHGLPELRDLDEYRAVFGFPVIEYYRRLGFDFSKNPYEELAKEWVEDYESWADQLTLYPDVPRILHTVQEKRIPQTLLSATEKGMLMGQLEQLGIGSFFDEIYGADNYHAHGKADLAREWKKEHPGATPLMIGDTDHDAQIAKLLGADVILLTCGHQARKTLEEAHPLMICNTPAEIPFDELFSIRD